MVDGTVPGFQDYEAAIAAYPAQRARRRTVRRVHVVQLRHDRSAERHPAPVAADQDQRRRRVRSARCRRQLWNFDSNTVYLSPAPLYHSAPLGFSTGTQALGGTVVMMPKFDPLLALQAIAGHRVTHSQWVPTMFSRMLKVPEEERARVRPVVAQGRDPRGGAVSETGQTADVRLVGTDPVRVLRRHRSERADPRHAAGLAETSRHRRQIGARHAAHLRRKRRQRYPTARAGSCISNYRRCRSSTSTTRTRRKSAQHPQHPNWSALGDVGYIDDEGYLFLTDRATFMIISGGVNIYPQEIEDAMVMHPKIADVAVVGVPNEEMGEEVKAVVQLAPGLTPSPQLAAELLAFAREHIAHYKCPRSIDFEAELPRLPTGKLYKRLLKDRYWGKHDSRIV